MRSKNPALILLVVSICAMIFVTIATGNGWVTCTLPLAIYPTKDFEPNNGSWSKNPSEEPVEWGHTRIESEEPVEFKYTLINPDKPILWSHTALYPVPKSSAYSQIKEVYIRYDDIDNNGSSDSIKIINYESGEEIISISKKDFSLSHWEEIKNNSPEFKKGDAILLEIKKELEK